MRKKITLLLTTLLISLFLFGCGKQSADVSASINGIQHICELATLKCVYHNVATVITSGDGFLGKFANRKIWVEYDGDVTLGIDTSKLSFNQKGNVLEITVPQAKVLGTNMNTDEENFSSENYYYDDENIMTKIIAGDIKLKGDEESIIIGKAQEEMEKAVSQDTALLKQAQERAEQLIQGYVNQISEESGIKYEIKWVELPLETTEPESTEPQS